jgi:hypothetical protein
MCEATHAADHVMSIVLELTSTVAPALEAAVREGIDLYDFPSRGRALLLSAARFSEVCQRSEPRLPGAYSCGFCV